jgi:DNA-binding transcriptional MerR regulator
MSTQDMFADPFYKYRHPQVESALKAEGIEYDLQELSSSVLSSIDIAKFQTRDVEGDDNFVDGERVQGFAESIKNGDPLPACVLFYVNNKYIALDGRHRIEAHKLAESKCFAAYVITKIDESTMHLNALRLSNMFNEMNGERAGKDDEERKQRKVQIELCANECFKLISNGVSQEEVRKDIPKKYKILRPSHTKQVFDLVARSLIELDLAADKSMPGTKTQQLVNAIGSCEIQNTQNISRRCEQHERVKLLEAIKAAKNHGINSYKINEILKSNQHSAASKVIESIQEEAGLDKNNTKMQAAERVLLNQQAEVKKSIFLFGKQLGFKINFFGDDKSNLVKQLQNLVSEIKAYIVYLESI